MTGVRIAGCNSPRIRSTDTAEHQQRVLEPIQAVRPDLVLVAFGAPKQELFIHRHANALRPAVLLGVGASLDFVAGRVRRAPRWISRAGMEWLFRLALEPRRLARRYLVDDPAFLAILLRTLREPRERRVS
jgi:N-acetylglucosaminyldiphosphoundecaprenol N-acetyl-beta-D-mannosaminyltransferase